MYKVFFNDRIVFINGNTNKTADVNSIQSTITNELEGQVAWRNFLNNSSKSNLYLTGGPDKEILKLFMKNFKVVEAAGGLVFNQKNQLLCIYRWNKWDLPKGKIEKNEEMRDAAIREVQEETGISGVVIEDFKGTTYHIFRAPYIKDRLVLKPTYWFTMRYNGNEELIPQLKEDIVKAQWFDLEKLEEVKANTYKSLLDLFDF